MPWFVNLIPSLLIIVFFVAMFVMMRLPVLHGRRRQGDGLRQGADQAAGR